MAVTKTNFINYIRCPRFVALDKVHKDKLEADISLSEYLEEEYLNNLLSTMHDGDEDLIDVTNEQLETMMPYYLKVEKLAGELVNKKLEGIPKYSDNTYYQERFDTNINGIKYLCYVDIYNDRDNSFDIIEVKATTISKFLKLITKDEKGIYRLLDEIDFEVDKQYFNQKSKLYDRLSDIGRYVYDLAIQRYIIENDLKDKLPENVRYYLAVLNSEYVYDGKSEYEVDSNGNEIICLIDLTKVTEDLMDKIEIDRKKIEEYIFKCDITPYKLGKHCEHKKTTKCKFCITCFSHIPEYNSIFSYIDGHFGFKDKNGNKYERFDLVNDGMISMLDVPTNYLNRRKNQIQKSVVETNKTYINKEKIEKGLEFIKYPIYHLDFETFPCPLPRHRGEKPYSQSVFQFSLHIEEKPGLCDKNKDHYEFLAPDLKDYREEIIKKLIEYIKNAGTVLVYSENFEKSRLKELGEIFPKYKKGLEKISNRIFDLLFLIKSNTKFYEELGFNDEEAKLFNYYHKDLNGSFSIKNVLPVFSKLTYENMEVANGMEALSTFASFNDLDEETYKKKYKALIEYCKQDTWAMVEILRGLRNL